MPKAPENLVLLGRLLFQAFPAVNRELMRWRHLAASSPEPELSQQALASLTFKKFHCQGGSVYATWPPRYRQQILQAIVALQTISDYLDNLCDRAGVLDEKAFRQLHLAFTDALRPGRAEHDYYASYPYRQDGGYLKALVRACRQALMVLPGYKIVQEEILYLADLYCHLQATKHIDITRRQERLQSWLEPLLGQIPAPIYWWELAAATGSTLGIFALIAVAAREELTAPEVTRLKNAYFPWIGGLHILLDYFIDQQEDREGGDLNFCAFYCDEEEAARRLQFFLEQSLEKAQNLPDPAFHLMVVRGLPALYLSDAKVAGQKQASTREAVLRAAGSFSQNLYLLCKTLRWVGVI
ncbi:Terpenoid synthase [Moorella glycerini]|uniref:Tetraprenyl-beta-curcumene synthase n=1 Tax=Neomoorella stamsii TaxID=1266720 RepID=A0A9X7J4U0_9FIRM|nr:MULTISPECIES: tetraprenyl-beta-curcumene synthase family protein [Moorella]PRR73724.1 Tetraprenyl-beta-curcumene synthase [Moorella stamsii]CEP66330.1 Terpenoid synthase [Moorella glycerini]